MAGVGNATSTEKEPLYVAIIQEAVLALEKSGKRWSSRVAIKKRVEAEHKIVLLPSSYRTALRYMVTNGLLKQGAQSFASVSEQDK